VRCFSPSGLTPNFPHFSSDPTDSPALPVSGIDFRDFEKRGKKEKKRKNFIPPFRGNVSDKSLTNRAFRAFSVQRSFAMRLGSSFNF